MRRAGSLWTAIVVGFAVVVAGLVGVVGATGAFDSHPGAHGSPVSGPTYNVTFEETGLPAGTTWSVHLAGVWGGWSWGHRGWASSNSSTIVVALPNGTFHYQVDRLFGYTITGGRGVVNVSGASPATIDVAFQALPEFAATFVETGLTAGTSWTVAIFGHAPGQGRAELAASSTTDTISIELPNGSYHYRVVPIFGYSLTGGYGGFAVAGSAPAQENATFTALPLYAATFNETGLPSGTNWSVYVFGFDGPGIGFVRTGATSDTSTLTLSLPNGTYVYAVGPVFGYAVTAGGPFGLFNVTGAPPPAVSVTFSPWNSTGSWP